MKKKFASCMPILFILIVCLNAINASAETVKSGAYKIDPAHSNVQFRVSHLGFSYLIGRFNSIEGKLKLVPYGDSKVEVTIQAASIDSNHQKRDKHLRGPDFFNVKRYPVIKFVSSKVIYNSQGKPVSVKGKLTMHGVSANVTLEVNQVGAGKDPWGGYRVGYHAKTTIKRSEYGMNYMPSGIGDEVMISLDVEAIKE